MNSRDECRHWFQILWQLLFRLWSVWFVSWLARTPKTTCLLRHSCSNCWPHLPTTGCWSRLSSCLPHWRPWNPDWSRSCCLLSLHWFKQRLPCLCSMNAFTLSLLVGSSRLPVMQATLWLLRAQTSSESFWRTPTKTVSRNQKTGTMRW